METLLTFITVLAWPVAVVFLGVFLVASYSAFTLHRKRQQLGSSAWLYNSDYSLAWVFIIWTLVLGLPTWAWLGVRYFA